MSSGLTDLVSRQVQEVLPQIIEFRHLLHSEPEIGVHTIATREKILRMVSGTSLDLRPPLVGGDVVGELHGSTERTVCLRADVDAILADEANDVPYASKTSGAMHGCGHDGHTAMLVGALLVLDRIREILPNTIRFVFQPGEELFCTGRDMVAKGVCDGCEAAFALHAWPGIPLGTVSSKAGAVLGAGIQYVVTLTGRGCHGGWPERGNNPIASGVRIADELMQLHAEVNQEDRSVVSVCRFVSGTNSNIIPETATLQGTVRFVEDKRGEYIRGRIQSILDEAVHRFGIQVKAEFDDSYSLPVNNTSLGHQHIRQAAVEMLGADKWIESPETYKGMEDFAFYLPGREGGLFLLGMGEDSPSLHSEHFNFNDEALAAGIMMHCMLALSY